MADIKNNLNELKNNITNKIESTILNCNSITTSGVSLRIGNKIVRFKTEEVVQSVEEEIREELMHELKDKLKELSNYVDKKLNEAHSTVVTITDEYQRKEKILNDKLANSKPMPYISWEQAKRGLSVIPESSTGIAWLVRKVYWPKFVDNSLIEPKYQKKMITPVIIYIVVEKDIIKRIDIKTINLENFDHYHAGCWGNWLWSKIRIKNAEDILNVADEAIAVLEKINTMSIARRTPSGLPRLETLMRNLVNRSVDDVVTDNIVSRNLERTGVSLGTDGDVWSVTATG